MDWLLTGSSSKGIHMSHVIVKNWAIEWNAEDGGRQKWWETKVVGDKNGGRQKWWETEDSGRQKMVGDKRWII
jgi:hypothetical protein